MKAFGFSFQKALDAREAREKAAEAELAKALDSLQRAEREWARIKRSARRQVKSMSSLEGGLVSSPDLSRWSSFLDDLYARLEAQAARVEEEQRKADALRKELTERMKERKVMEQLKARERHRWLIEQRRIELKSMDEIASTGFLRQRKESAVAADTGTGMP